MNAGTLRHVISIQERVGTDDGMGGELQLWTNVYTDLRGEELPYQSREVWAGDRVESQPQVRWRLRYVSGITPAMRLVHGSRIFNIQGVINVDGRSRELILMCTEQLNG